MTDRLSYANVIATLALFVALGGSSYAALSVGSKQIANNSVRSKDLRNNDVRGRDIRKSTVRASDVRNGALQGKDVRDDALTGADVMESTLAAVPSAQNALTLGGKPASAFLGSDKQQRTGLIKLTHGQTKTFASSGPFTWRAICSDDGGGSTRLRVTLQTTEAGSFGGPGGERSPRAHRSTYSTTRAPHRSMRSACRCRRSPRAGQPPRTRLRRHKGRRRRLRGQRHPLALEREPGQPDWAVPVRRTGLVDG